MEVTVGIVGSGCYLAAALWAAVSMRRTAARGEKTAWVLMGAGAVALGAMLAARGARAESLPAFSRFEGLACYALAVTAAYLLLVAVHRARGLLTLVLPYLLVVLACGLPAVSSASGPPVPLQGSWLALHVVTGFAAYAVFTLTSLLAVAYLVQDRNLKRKRMGAIGERLPSLETLDHLMTRLVGLAFLLFTVTIAVGFLLVRRGGSGQEWFTDPKVGATMATWILFGVLVHLRASADRHGRGVAILAVAGLACLLFAFLGVHLVADSVHSFLRLRAGAGGP